MGASGFVRVSLAALLAGCAAPQVQPGLANAPVLGGTTPETRVHDVIANGHDACERSAFPPGEVLRGHVPPCNPGEKVTKPSGLPAPALGRTWIPESYPLGVCLDGTPRRRSSAGQNVTALSLYTPSSPLGCDE